VPSPLSILRNADVYAPRHVGRRDLVVGGGVILAIEDRISGVGVAADEIDLAGARVVPGLIDAHVHLTGGGGESGPQSRVPRVAFSALARAGITTAIGVLGTDGTTRTVASLVAATLGLRAEGLSAYCYTGSYEVPPITLTGSVRSDITFVDPILGVGELAISDHRSSQPTLDEVLRIAADCHVAGLMSDKAGVLHLHLGDGPRGLDVVNRALDTTELPARVFYPTHVNRKKKLFEEAVLLARRGCTVDVTAFPVEEGEDAWSACDAVERFLSSGAPKDRLTVSSDGGGCLPTFDAQGHMVTMDVGRPSAVADTLRQLLTRGHALDAVLPIFTENVASLLRLRGKGVIAAGAHADLVVLDEEGGIRDVMCGGRFLVRRGQSVVLGTFEGFGAKASS
jgi:beta-aspartyl-dipeptidase (metallo-type)